MVKSWNELAYLQFKEGFNKETTYKDVDRLGKKKKG